MASNAMVITYAVDIPWASHAEYMVGAGGEAGHWRWQWNWLNFWWCLASWSPLSFWGRSWCLLCSVCLRNTAADRRGGRGWVDWWSARSCCCYRRQNNFPLLTGPSFHCSSCGSRLSCHCGLGTRYNCCCCGWFLCWQWTPSSCCCVCWLVC